MVNSQDISSPILKPKLMGINERKMDLPVPYDKLIFS